jgi:hypothetical protein
VREAGLSVIEVESPIREIDVDGKDVGFEWCIFGEA